MLYMAKQLKINNRVIADALTYIDSAYPQPVTKNQLANRLGVKPNTSKVWRVMYALEEKKKIRVTKTSGQYLIYSQ